jgi:uncharacterized damage-inducible protein DinB
MDPAFVLQTQFDIVERQFKAVLKGLTLGQILWLPDPDGNSIGFLLWHLLYTWDEYMSLVEKREIIYIQDGWSERFEFETQGLGAGGSGMGTGFTPEDVAIVRPRPEALLDYLRWLSKEMQDYLKKATEESLEADVIVPWWKPKTASAGRVLIHIIAHSNFHIGEAQYVRGLARGRANPKSLS